MSQYDNKRYFKKVRNDIHPVMANKETGLIKKLHRSYGSIQRHNSPVKLFFHFSQVVGNSGHLLKIGDNVEYDVLHDWDKGKLVAKDVSKIGPEVVMSEEPVIGTETTTGPDCSEIQGSRKQRGRLVGQVVSLAPVKPGDSQTPSRASQPSTSATEDRSSGPNVRGRGRSIPLGRGQIRRPGEDKPDLQKLGMKFGGQISITSSNNQAQAGGKKGQDGQGVSVMKMKGDVQVGAAFSIKDAAKPESFSSSSPKPSSGESSLAVDTPRVKEEPKKVNVKRRGRPKKGQAASLRIEIADSIKPDKVDNDNEAFLGPETRSDKSEPFVMPQVRPQTMLTNIRMSKFGRVTKFKHMKGTPMHKSMHFENLKNLSKSVPADCDFIQVNSERVAVPLAGPGGKLAVFEMSKSGRIPNGVIPAVINTATVMDFTWNPFNNNRLAVVTDDGGLNLWDIPQGGLVSQINEPTVHISAHQSEKANMIKYNPVAENIVATAGLDFLIKIWNLSGDNGEEVAVLQGHTDQIYSLGWSQCGTFLASVCRDGKVRIYNPRQSQTPVREDGDIVAKNGARVVWVCDGKYLVVTGFSRQSERQVMIYETRDLNCVHTETLDVSPAILIPFYDEDSSTLFLSGKGETTIYGYEITQDAPHMFPLSPFKANTPSQGLAFIAHKNALNVREVEFARGYRLTTTGITPISFTVPRVKSTSFQDDIFPTTRQLWRPACGASDWAAGSSAQPEWVSLQPADMPSLSGNNSTALGPGDWSKDSSGQEQEMPPPMLTAGTMSDIMEDVQPRNNADSSGVSKSSAEAGEEEQESKRMVTVLAMTSNGQQLYTMDLLGVDAESLASETATVITNVDLDNVTSPDNTSVMSTAWSQPLETLVPSHQLSAPSRSPTCSNPSVDDYPGHYMFDVIFPKHSSNTKNKNWDYSPILRKLFINMNQLVQVEFKVGQSQSIPNDLFIRILPVFSDATNCREPVNRCPNHASPTDQSNVNFDFPNHLVRVDNSHCLYEEDTSSGRLSTRFPVSSPHVGSDTVRELVKFMCLGSDVGGINRRPLKVIFTLETGQGVVVGRKVFDVRICSCPKRDKQQEEEKAFKEAKSKLGILSSSSDMSADLENIEEEEKKEQQEQQPQRRRSKRNVSDTNLMLANIVDNISDVYEVQDKKSKKRKSIEMIDVSNKPKCFFCKKKGIDVKGPVFTSDSEEIFYHSNCCMFFKDLTFEDNVMVGFMSNEICQICNLTGAVLKCDECSKLCHMNCGISINWEFNVLTMSVECPDHIPK